MSSFETARKIALLIAFLKVQLRTPDDKRANQNETAKKKRRAALSDSDLAHRLMKVQSDLSSPYKFDGDRVNQLLNARIDTSSDEEAKIFEALQLLIKKEEEPFNIDVRETLPRWLEHRYAKELRELLREPRTQSPIRGAPLGHVAELLNGAWQFFYMSPTNDKGERKAQIRGFAIIFGPADASSMQVLAVSGRRHWLGSAYLIASHIYIAYADLVDRGGEFLVVNAPTTHHGIVVGTGAGLELFVERPHLTPGVIGFYCFGARKHEGELVLSDVLSRLSQGGQVKESDLAFIREKYCTPYSNVKVLRKDYPQLVQYVESHKINGEEGMPLAALHVAYP